jgi:hypothetical protein
MANRQRHTWTTCFRHTFYETGLPENVVPIIRGSNNIECIFSSDLKEYIHRSQVWVLLNFSMADYTSQGKTRPKIKLT